MKIQYISDVLQIEEALRLRRFDGNYDFAFEWYQDPETVLLVDGKAEPYSYETLTNMYNYLNDKGELYFIEVNEDGKWKPIGDVTFWQEDILLAVSVSGVIVTTLNTVILREMLFASWKVIPFAVLWLPRAIEELLAGVVKVCFMGMLTAVCAKMAKGIIR